MTKCSNCNNCCQCNKDDDTVSKPPKYVKPPESESSDSERVKLKTHKEKMSEAYNDRLFLFNSLFVGFIFGLIIGFIIGLIVGMFLL